MRSNWNFSPGRAAASVGSSLAGGQNLQRSRVQILQEIVARFRVGAFEKPIVEAHFGLDGVLGRNPVNGGFDFAPVGGVAAARGRVIGGVDFDDFARGVFDGVRAFDKVGVAQAHFVAMEKPEVFRLRRFLKSGFWVSKTSICNSL